MRIPPLEFSAGANNGANDNGRDLSYLGRIIAYGREIARGSGSRPAPAAGAACLGRSASRQGPRGKVQGEEKRGEANVEREDELVAAII